jgi:polysaccharide pyruvyl transferase WcaK-like protein
VSSGPKHEVSDFPAQPGELGGALLASPETARALTEADSVALLVGGYDGSGNYGDLALLDGALEITNQLEPPLLTLPVIERQYAQTHGVIGSELIHRSEHVLYFDDGSGDFEDELVPTVPGELAFAFSYLYGGGYLNPSWGARKLAMLRAVEQLVARARQITRIATGQQVDAAWIAGLPRDDARLLASFEFLGGRDEASARALGQLGSAVAPTNTGDDAVGILSRAVDDLAGAALDVVNVHIAEHEWVTDDPDALRIFDVGLLEELARLGGRPLRVRPLVAYLDPRVDEEPGLARFAAACAERGIELDEARVLRPAGLAADAGDLSRAVLTISCSFHVALTSLLLGVPAVLLRNNPYYDQKARGLLADFELPAEFSPSYEDDPQQCAARIAPALFGGPAPREELRAAAGRVRRRRSEVEVEVLARVSRGAMSPAPPRGAATQPPRAMPSRSSHLIVDIQQTPGELSFETRLQGTEPKRIWLRTSSEVEPGADAVLPAALLPTMRIGGTLTIDQPLSPRILRMQREFQGIQRAWSRTWPFGDPPLREVEVIAPARQVERRRPTGRTAAFFSGGVDSFSTVFGEEGVTDLIFVRGLDILARFDHQEGLADRVESKLREAAEELRLPLHVVDTNLRDLSEATGAEKPLARWEAQYNSALAAVALFLEPLFDRVLVATAFAYEDQLGLGASWMVDQLWGTENMEIVDTGGLLGRAARIEQIATSPIVQKTLRVCWQNPGGAYNCGRCRKCLLTMATLEAVGQLGRFETFPAELDLEQLESTIEEVPTRTHLLFCEDALEAMRRNNRPDLEQAVGRLVAAGRQKLGLDADPVGDAERRQAEAEAKLAEVLASRSWRLTAPLRRLKGS